ncbi:MAG: pseudouridine synthase [Candidatus Melainabacteria bacterium]|nr:pseudouridine synthase [Candidatus Melainabacteria bacterium]
MMLSSKNERLNKVIAASGLCSRRKADELIAQGVVKVNGVKITEQGFKVPNPLSDTVEVNGRALRVQQTIRTVAFYKPPGVITTRNDELGRKTIYDVLPPELHHLDPAGRLDRKTAGLIFLSNDGDFLYQMTHPKYSLPTNSDALAAKLLEGVFFEEEQKLAQAQEVFQILPDTYGVTLVTGMNRQVRRMFEVLGFDVISLKRVSIGSFVLSGLQPGEWRDVKFAELKSLLKSKPQPKKEKPEKKSSSPITAT